MKKREVLRISIQKDSKTTFEGSLTCGRKLSVANLEAIKEWAVKNLDRAIEDKKKMEK